MTNSRKAMLLRSVVLLSIFSLAGAMWGRSFAGRYTVGQILTRVAISVAAFCAFPLVYRIWPPPEGPPFPTKRFLVGLFFYGVVLFAWDFYQVQVEAWFSAHPTVSRLITSGHALLFPLLLLGVFFGVMGIIHRHAR